MEEDSSIEKKQNQIFSTSLVSYQTFQGWDWLGSVSYSKSLNKPLGICFDNKFW